MRTFEVIVLGSRYANAPGGVARRGAIWCNGLTTTGAVSQLRRDIAPGVAEGKAGLG